MKGRAPAGRPPLRTHATGIGLSHVSGRRCPVAGATPAPSCDAGPQEAKLRYGTQESCTRSTWR